MSIYPTLCELSGLPIPSHVEGISIRKLLAHPDVEWDRPALTTHGFQQHAVRSERWRYIRYKNGDEELYDEADDPYEWTNLANDSKYDPVKIRLATFFPTVNVEEVARRSRATQRPRERRAKLNCD